MRDPPVIAKVSWDVALPSIKTVKVFVLDRKAGEVLFTGPSAVVGSVNTGVWAVANMVFILRDGDSMKQITKFTEAPRAAIDSELSGWFASKESCR
jgi:hypothetical protein